MANWEAGYYTVVQDNFGNFCLFSTKNENGTLRHSGFLLILEDAITNTGSFSGYSKDIILEVAKDDNWKIIDTIHPSELMGSGLKPGQKVRIKENAKEECEKYHLGWNEHMGKMVGKICEVMKKLGSDYTIYNGNKTDFWLFPPTALSPVYEDDTKTTWLEEGKKNGWVKDGNIVV